MSAPAVTAAPAPPRETSLPPGPRAPLPWLTLNFLLRPDSFLDSCYRRYGDFFTIRVPGRTIVIVADPEAIKQVFTGDPDVLHAGEGNVVLAPLLGTQSVLLLDGDAHMRQRKLMLPSFHGERMQRYRDVMADVTERQVDTWRSGAEFPVFGAMQQITLEVIMRAVFGIEDTGRLDRLSGALRQMLDITSQRRRFIPLILASSERNDRPWRRFMADRAKADELLFEEIRARRADPSASERDDIMSLLLSARHEDGSAMSDGEMRDELMTLLVAGHETTATALTWTIERLVRHPDVLARLTDEVRAGEDDAYLDAVIKETLRLRPVVPAVARRLTEPWELKGHLLPAGVNVAPSIYLTHRLPDVYPDPTAFRPERFLEQPTGTYTWIPFGGGVRRCLGATFALFEAKTVLATILERVALTADRPAPERISRRAITLVPARGGRVVVA
jgi:cytochrome P450